MSVGISNVMKIRADSNGIQYNDAVRDPNPGADERADVTNWYEFLASGQGLTWTSRANARGTRRTRSHSFMTRTRW